MLKALAGFKEKFLVIAVSGHVDVAEVQFIKNQEFGKVQKFKNIYPGDYVFIYDDSLEEGKSEISAAYDRIASTAQISGTCLSTCSL